MSIRQPADGPDRLRTARLVSGRDFLRFSWDRARPWSVSGQACLWRHDGPNFSKTRISCTPKNHVGLSFCTVTYAVYTFSTNQMTDPHITNSAQNFDLSQVSSHPDGLQKLEHCFTPSLSGFWSLDRLLGYSEPSNAYFCIVSPLSETRCAEVGGTAQLFLSFVHCGYKCRSTTRSSSSSSPFNVIFPH